MSNATWLVDRGTNRRACVTLAPVVFLKQQQSDYRCLIWIVLATKKTCSNVCAVMCVTRIPSIAVRRPRNFAELRFSHVWNAGGSGSLPPLFPNFPAECASPHITISWFCSRNLWDLPGRTKEPLCLANHRSSFSKLCSSATGMRHAVELRREGWRGWFGCGAWFWFPSVNGQGFDLFFHVDIHLENIRHVYSLNYGRSFQSDLLGL